MNYYKTTCKQITYVLQSRQLKRNYVNRFTQVNPRRSPPSGVLFWNFIRGEPCSSARVQRTRRLAVRTAALRQFSIRQTHSDCAAKLSDAAKDSFLSNTPQSHIYETVERAMLTKPNQMLFTPIKALGTQARTTPI